MGKEPGCVDGNGVVKAAYVGEYWTADGWESAEYCSIRDTVRQRLAHMQQFYGEQGVWPVDSPVDPDTPIVRKPDNPIFVDHAGDPIPSRDALEAAYVQEYADVGMPAFQSETRKVFVEWREGLDPT